MSDHCATHPPALAMLAEPPADGSMNVEPRPPEVPRRRRSRMRHQQQASTARFVAAALCFMAAANAFSSTPLHAGRRRCSSRPSWETPWEGGARSRTNGIHGGGSAGRRGEFYMSTVAESSRASDFQRRMRGLVQRNNNAGGTAAGGRTGTAGRRAVQRPANLKTVETLQEYKDALDANRDKIVVVRFYATWCKACRAIQPSYHRMASLYPRLTFLEVPVTNHNANLHQGLEVPSLPYGHIYYPGAGLVEEMRISKRHFANLVRTVRWYDAGRCALEEHVPPREREEGPPRGEVRWDGEE